MKLSIKACNHYFSVHARPSMTDVSAVRAMVALLCDEFDATEASEEDNEEFYVTCCYNTAHYTIAEIKAFYADNKHNPVVTNA